MYLIKGYNYYYLFTNSTAPGVIVKIIEIDESDNQKRYWFDYKGMKIGVSDKGFVEPTPDEWCLVDGFKKLGWSWRKQSKWCNRLFPRKRGIELAICAFGGWNSNQKAIAAAALSKIVRRSLGIK